MGTEKITNWRARAASWLYYQFRGKPAIKALVELVIGRQIQELEDALHAVLMARILDNAELGALDLWGELFNEPRDGRSDASYRIALALAVSRDRSGGTAEDMIAILAALTSAASVFLDELQTRAVRIYLEDPALCAELAANLRQLADGLAPAGVTVDLVAERGADYFGFDGDPSSDGWGTIEDPAVGGAWTKII